MTVIIILLFGVGIACMLAGIGLQVNEQLQNTCENPVFTAQDINGLPSETIVEILQEIRSIRKTLYISEKVRGVQYGDNIMYLQEFGEREWELSKTITK